MEANTNYQMLIGYAPKHTTYYRKPLGNGGFIRFVQESIIISVMASIVSHKHLHPPR